MTRTTLPARTPQPSSGPSSGPSNTPAGASAGGSPAALHLRSFAAGIVLALLLAGATTLALRWTPAPALVLHAPPTTQPLGLTAPAVQPTAARRGLTLPTPTLPAANPASASPASASPASTSPASASPASASPASTSPAPAQAAPPSQSPPLNVNTATAAELATLPGIGPAKAQAIIANRPYNTVDDLDGVPGIGPATLARLRPLVVVQ